MSPSSVSAALTRPLCGPSCWQLQEGEVVALLQGKAC